MCAARWVTQKWFGAKTTEPARWNIQKDRTGIVDAQGIFQAYTQVLSPQNFATIKAGMSRDQVRRILGKPRTVVKFDLKNEEVWDWRYLEGPVTERFFNVHFDLNRGAVTQTSVSDPERG